MSAPPLLFFPFLSAYLPNTEGYIKRQEMESQVVSVTSAIVHADGFEVFESMPRVCTSAIVLADGFEVFESTPRVYGTSELFTRTDSRLLSPRRGPPK